MSLDGMVTRALVHELQMTGTTRIHKIHQPTEHDLVLHMRVAGANRKLLLSANPTYPRIHFSEQVFVNPPEPPMFCMLMRKYCEGGIIERIEQVGMERVIHIYIRKRDELGDESVKLLIIELMGRHSNIILTEPATGQIVDGIHHITPAISSYRIIMPGFAYTAPPEQLKTNPLDMSEEAFKQLLSQEAELDEEHPDLAAKWLVQQLSGVSPLLAKEWVYRIGQLEGADWLNRAWSAFEQMMQPIRSNHYQSNIVESDDGKSYFSVLPLTHISGSLKMYDSISDCMEAFYGDKAERDMVKQRVGDLTRFLEQEKKKNLKKLDKLEDTIQEAQDADKYRIMGELLFANLYQIKRGDTSIALENFYDEHMGVLNIPLDPLLEPSENAQRYFRKYNKLKNSMQVVHEQMDVAKKENAYYDILLQQLSDANMQDAQEIREELIEQGLLRDRGRKQKRKKKDSRPTLYLYTSSEGIPIYVGKNNIQNEYLTNRLAKPNDTWLHTKDIPGSHVVIRSEEFGDATLEEAAQLAAYYSQAKHSSQVPVDHTLIRYVRKPSGAKPGFVIYDRQKTLYITPEEGRIRSLAFEMKQGG